MTTRIDLVNVIPEVFAPDVSVVNDSRVWLKEISFEKPSDYLVVAASGTGKSSLCSYLYGARHDYRGTILFDGEDIRRYDTKRWSELRRRSLAYLPQEIHLFGELTVMENIMLKNRLTDYYSESEIKRMLEELGLEQKANEAAGRISIGQQQRIGMIRAVCQPFDFILLDEPVSHLDIENNQKAAEFIIREAGVRNASIIATSVGNHLKFDPAKMYML